MDAEAYYISQLKSPYIGDDGAVVGDFIYSMDSFCENIHFKREWMSLEQIAAKAMLVNISDAIAMNAKPLYALISISLPHFIEKGHIDELIRGFQNVAHHYGCEIIGGDTIGGEKLDITITIISKSDNPLYRTGLKAGDILAYTGVLGGSKRDLNALFEGKNVAPTSRFIAPILREDFIYRSREYLRVGMDISDGLFCDTNKLLEANNLGCELIEAIDEALSSSGEEYEMLIGFDPQHLATIQALAGELPITPFAKVTPHPTPPLPCQSHHF
ncbi:MAG: thiamine monophosphate kinase [Sulfurovum sp. FS08-3]|nr:MAG: thiamine monophosphate kinase [Sulfurovum sp. FS08-3]